MSGPKPFEQWPSRTAAALDMRAKGWTIPQIAGRLGVSANAVSGLLASAQHKRKHSGLGTPKRPAHRIETAAPRPMQAEAGHTVSIIMPAHTYARLIDAARAATKTPAEFVKHAVLTALLEG